jgi:hypothetical protein
MIDQFDECNIGVYHVTKDNMWLHSEESLVAK